MLTNYFRSKKFTARHPLLSLDFSPMSALGLLLINFFMVQAMWKKPQVMPLTMPDNEFHGCGEMVKESKVLNLLCGPDKVYVYTGITEPKLDSVDYSAEGLRKCILQNKTRVDRQFGLTNTLLNCAQKRLLQSLTSRSLHRNKDWWIVTDEMRFVRYAIIGEQTLSPLN